MSFGAFARSVFIGAAWVISCEIVPGMATLRAADVVTFESLAVPSSGYFNGDPGLPPDQFVSGTWTSSGVRFPYTFSLVDYGMWGVFTSWTGAAYSNIVDGTTPGYGNQYASYPGSGYGGSTKYAILYGDGARIILPGTSTVQGFQIANTTYAALAMAGNDGGSFNPDPLNQPGDFFSTTATGHLNGVTTGSATFMLASDPLLSGTTNILSGWAWFDLSSLGPVDSIEFTFAGSDTDPIFGLNTPTYFAMDNLTFTPVPEPSAVAILGSLVAVGALARRSRRRAA